MGARRLLGLVLVGLVGCGADPAMAPDAEIVPDAPPASSINGDYSVTWTCNGSECAQNNCDTNLCLFISGGDADAIALRGVAEPDWGRGYFWHSAGPTYAGESSAVAFSGNTKLIFGGWARDVNHLVTEFDLVRLGDGFEGPVRLQEIPSRIFSNYTLRIERLPQTTLPDIP